jgi:hypothetical protein
MLLVSEAMLVMRLVGVMVCRLRSMVMRVVLRLELGHLHGKPLMGLTAIHHDMLTLVTLAIHIEWVQRG